MQRGTPIAIAGAVTSHDGSLPRWRQSALALPFLALGLVVSSTAQQGPRVIDVTAKKYEFVPSTIEVAQGERVVLRVTSADRLHGIGIKRFKVNTEVPRGKTVDVEFVASEAGTFPVLCTEDCGKGHDDMTGTLVVKAVAQ
ncbi:MAG TPA: cupredoxin domain-containing protein [Luteitalea sp.]|nr:cupredoxin domain-containing protein [Luteitalea sp.]